jgi:putative chitobiose transport system substrate-binding protein
MDKLLTHHKKAETVWPVLKTLFFRPVVWVLIASCLLTACNRSVSSAPENTQEIVELEFWTLQLSTFAPQLQRLFKVYEKRHPHTHIRWVDIPFSEGSKRTLTALISGHPPDVVNLNPDFAALLAARNTLINMNTALTPEQKQVYCPVFWQSSTLNTLASLSAPSHSSALKSLAQPSFTFGLPWYVTSSVTLFNTRLLNAAHFSLPPDRLDDLDTFMQQIYQTRNGFAMMPQIAEGGYFLKLLQKLNLPLYNEKTGQAIFATPAAINLLNQYIKWYKAGLVPAEMLTEGHRAAVGRYQAGTLALINIGPNFLQVIKENAPAIYQQTKIAPQFPSISKIKDFALMILVVPQKSAHPKQALDFARFITSDESQLAFAQTVPVLPSSQKALKQVYTALQSADKQNKMNQALRLSALQLLEAEQAYPVLPKQQQIHETIDYFVQMALLNRCTAAQALQNAQQVINSLLKE